MYTVMLVSDQARVLQNFERFNRWEELGYTRPLLFTNVPDALAALNARSVQVVSIELSSGETAALYDRLHGMRMFYLEPVDDEAALAAVLERVSRMIEARAVSSSAQTPLMRETFFQTLLDGLMHSESVMRNRLNMLGLPDTADAACMLVTLRMLDGDTYLRDIWRYGRARLTMALRKFLQDPDEREGDDSPRVVYTISGLRAGTMRLLACPLAPASIDQLRGAAMSHVNAQVARVEEYLGLELIIESAEVLDGLKALLRKAPHG
jgi:hypothetical protein